VNAAAVLLPNVDELHVRRLGIDEHRYRRVRWFREESGGWRRVEPWMTSMSTPTAARSSGSSMAATPPPSAAESMAAARRSSYWMSLGGRSMDRDDKFDPYGPLADGQAPDDYAVLVRFVADLHEFIQDIFDHPPDVLKGEWLDEQREAWNELRTYPPLSARIESERITMQGRLPEHGLSGRSLRSKMNAWRDKARAFLARRGMQRLAKASRTGGVIMESVADAVGIGHAYKEVIKSLHHLAELVIEEGP
jgi:hypothetical protein